MSSGNLSRTARVYVWGVIAAGLAAVLAAGYELYTDPVGPQWFILAALTVVSGSATVKLPSVPAALTVSETFVFTSVLLFGAPAGTLTVALDGLIFSLWSKKQRKAPHRLLFNVAAPALSIWTAAKVFFWAADIRPLALVRDPAGISEFLLPLVLFTVLYFSLNSWLIAWAVALETSQPASRIWRENFVWVSLNFFCGASVAALLTVYPLRGDLSEINLTFLTYLGAVLPLLLVLYLTYKTSMGRVEDANKHLAEINEMYLSTIETLAMAVDAKDQVTHGHIRRVQKYAVELAKSLGLADRGLLKAIEAASLLHDLGKLAVPEHILNKPGKLTDAEFEKMKPHAAIGADILSAIQFPYPVIPIVRHHHENWDGTGYPDGLKGTDIPIGARILSVVDCFDALTSDRPYRPRLADDQAISILLQRRGTMYDPLVVDSFIHVHNTVGATDAFLPAEPSAALVELTRSIGGNRSQEPAGGTEWGATRATHILAVSRLTASLANVVEIRDAMPLMLKHLQNIIPHDLCTVMAYCPQSDKIELLFAAGCDASDLCHWSTPLGQRLSGWVAANRQAAVNSSPALDFGEFGIEALSQLRSSLVVPVLEGSKLVGVLGFYSRRSACYDNADRMCAELVAGQMGLILARDVHGRNIVTRRDALPSVAQVQAQLSTDSLGGAASTNAVLLLHNRGAAIQPALLVPMMHGFLRSTDFVFSVGDSEIGCLLRGSTADAASRVSTRLEWEITQLFGAACGTMIGVAILPEDAVTLAEALTIARGRLNSKQSAA
jgi:putative nucleotidyltransferase with HDIG domain